MSKAQYRLALLVLAVSGLAGGVLAGWLFPSRAAFAGEEFQIVEAQEFRLVDSFGRTRARLGLAASGFTAGGKPSSGTVPSLSQPYLCFMDAHGKQRLRLFLTDAPYPGGLHRGEPGLHFLTADSSRPIVQLDVQHGKAALRLCDNPRGPDLFVAPFERVGEQITGLAEHVAVLQQEVTALESELRGQDAE